MVPEPKPTIKKKVVVALQMHADVSVEIEVAEDATDQQIKEAASLASGAVDIKEFDVYDSKLIHVVHNDGDYIY
jgi:hypothetical protein